MKLAVVTVVFLAVFGHMASGDFQQQLALSAATSNFAQRLYQKIAWDTSNVVYSPYSVHSALSMTYLGARFDTAQEMEKVLDLGSLPGHAAHDAYHDLIIQLNTAQDVKLNTANALYANPNKPIEQDYMNDVRTTYFAKVDNFDLAAPEGPERAINDFVAEKTEDMIKNVLPRGSIDSNTQLVLVNTLLFKGTWHRQFETMRTERRDFNQLNGARSQVDMMFDERSIRLKRDYVNGVDVAELPFKGERFGLYIALPRETDGITDLETMLSTSSKVDELWEGLTPRYAQVGIPKFKIENMWNLPDKLKQLGMFRAFDPADADLTGISQTANVFLDQVIHKALIEVNETGTVAAAATVIVGSKMAGGFNDADERFIADHPFMFFLRDKQTKQILFQGRFSG